jgi:hypothetical protein
MRKISNSIAQLVWLAAAVTVMVLASSVELLGDMQQGDQSDRSAQKVSASTNTNINTSAKGSIGLGEILNLKPSMGYAVQDPPGKVEPR